MKGGQEVRYRQKVVEILKWKDVQGCGAGRSFIAELEPNRQSEADFLVINEGLRVTHNIVWYDPLEPGKYELTIRRRFGCFKGPEAESDTIYFEVVADQASHKRLQPTPR